MDYEDFDTEDIEDCLWADFWSKRSGDYENHEVYHPSIIYASSSRKPGYDMPHSVGVRECTVA